MKINSAKDLVVYQKSYDLAMQASISKETESTTDGHVNIDRGKLFYNAELLPRLGRI